MASRPIHSATTIPRQESMSTFTQMQCHFYFVSLLCLVFSSTFTTDAYWSVFIPCSALPPAQLSFLVPTLKFCSKFMGHLKREGNDRLSSCHWNTRLTWLGRWWMPTFVGKIYKIQFQVFYVINIFLVGSYVRNYFLWKIFWNTENSGTWVS